MYLWEMKELPKKADKATLEWDKGISSPQRERNRIGLPLDSHVRYFPFLDGKQFLIQAVNRAWFGGTDEEPFLVEMNPEIIDNYIEDRGNVDAFYADLVPSRVSDLSKETGIPYRRQGDIFAAKFCGERYFEDRLASLVGAKVQEAEMSILGTRHRGKGRGIIINSDSRRDTQVLFRGVIEAPDHKPINLSDGLYLLGQTRYIVNPLNAD